MSGRSLVALSKQFGHATTHRLVEQHYSHFANAWRA